MRVLLIDMLEVTYKKEGTKRLYRTKCVALRVIGNCALLHSKTVHLTIALKNLVAVEEGGVK